MIGITIAGNHPSLGLGDKLQFSSFPENFHANTGEKVIDLDGHWFFDHNPYVVRGEDPSLVLDLWGLGNHWYDSRPIISSIAERTIKIVEQVLKNEHIYKNVKFRTILNHPRLYKFENFNIGDAVCHFSGRAGGDLDEKVVAEIDSKYGGSYNLIRQSHNRAFCCKMMQEFVDFPIWKVAELIAQSDLFIGLDSGLSHIARCFPHIRRKIILTKYSEEKLENEVVPMLASEGDYHWLDGSCEYFNCFDHDISFTKSYKKI